LKQGLRAKNDAKRAISGQQFFDCVTAGHLFSQNLTANKRVPYTSSENSFMQNWPFHASQKIRKTASRSQKKVSNHVSRENANSIHVSQNIQIQSLQKCIWQY